MSYKFWPEQIEGIRKVKWDELWHIIYKEGKSDNYDRVSKKEAMQVLRKVERCRKENKPCVFE